MTISSLHPTVFLTATSTNYSLGLSSLGSLRRRRSSLGLVRTLPVIDIEVLRGVPLIAVLYIATLLLPLVLPNGVSIDKLLRAQVAIILFVSPSMAEIVRAGLQSIPSRQF